jgi:hypothetical protein
MKNTPELLLEFIKFNSSLSLLMLGAFGWIVSKEVGLTGKPRWYHGLCVISFCLITYNLHQLTSLIIAMIKESAGTTPSFVSEAIQGNISCSVYSLWAAAGFLVLFLFFQALNKKENV